MEWRGERLLAALPVPHDGLGEEIRNFVIELLRRVVAAQAEFESKV